SAQRIHAQLDHQPPDAESEQRDAGSDPELAYRFSAGKAHHQMARLVKHDGDRETGEELDPEPPEIAPPKAREDRPPQPESRRERERRAGEAPEAPEQRRPAHSGVAHGRSMMPPAAMFCAP